MLEEMYSLDIAGFARIVYLPKLPIFERRSVCHRILIQREHRLGVKSCLLTFFRWSFLGSGLYF